MSSSYYDCSPETIGTKVKAKIYSNKIRDTIHNITGIFMLLTSVGVTSFVISTFTRLIKEQSKHELMNLLFLLAFACINIIVVLLGMYFKIPNMSIYGFSSFSIIGIYLIYLFLSGNLKDLKLPTIQNSLIYGIEPIPSVCIITTILILGLSALYSWKYNNWKKFSIYGSKRVKRERKRKRNTASAILSFSSLGALLLVALVVVYKNKDIS
jgi:predicted nucleic acid-binding Zn ribbon protein